MGPRCGRNGWRWDQQFSILLILFINHKSWVSIWSWTWTSCHLSSACLPDVQHAGDFWRAHWSDFRFWWPHAATWWSTCGGSPFEVAGKGHDRGCSQGVADKRDFVADRPQATSRSQGAVGSTIWCAGWTHLSHPFKFHMVTFTDIDIHCHCHCIKSTTCVIMSESRYCSAKVPSGPELFDKFATVWSRVLPPREQDLLYLHQWTCLGLAQLGRLFVWIGIGVQSSELPSKTKVGAEEHSWARRSAEWGPRIYLGPYQLNQLFQLEIQKPWRTTSVLASGTSSVAYG